MEMSIEDKTIKQLSNSIKVLQKANSEIAEAYDKLKADYENRLKADMVAMLKELKNELIDVSWNMDMYDSDLDFECCYLNEIDEIIHQKINSLKKVKITYKVRTGCR